MGRAHPGRQVSLAFVGGWLVGMIVVATSRTDSRLATFAKVALLLFSTVFGGKEEYPYVRNHAIRESLVFLVIKFDIGVVASRFLSSATFEVES